MIALSQRGGHAFTPSGVEALQNVLNGGTGWSRRAMCRIRLAIRELVENWGEVFRATPAIGNGFASVWHRRRRHDGRPGPRGPRTSSSAPASRAGTRRQHPAFPAAAVRSMSPATAPSRDQDDNFAARQRTWRLVRRGLHRRSRFPGERAGSGGVVLRRPDRRRDRLDPLDPSAKLQFDQRSCRAFPRATGISPMRRASSATRSRRICRA